MSVANATDEGEEDDVSEFMEAHNIYDAQLHQTLKDNNLDLTALRSIQPNEVTTTAKEFQFPVKQKVRFTQLMKKIHDEEAAKLPKPDDSMNVMLIGDMGSGKTSLINKYCKNQFREHLASTPVPQNSVDTGKFIETLSDDKNMEVIVWDTAGQEEWQSVSRGYYRKGDCIMFCYDMSEQEPFAHEKYWRDAIKDYARDDVLVVMVGCKYDLAMERNKSMYAKNKVLAAHLIAKSAWKRYKTVQCECSAKTGHNVKQVFVMAAELVHMTRKKRKRQMEAEAEAEAIRLHEQQQNNQNPPDSSSCCSR